MFTSSNEKLIHSDAVYSMIIQIRDYEENHSHIQEFLNFLLEKKYFPKLEHLMLVGFPIYGEFIKLIMGLDVKVLSLKNFMKPYNNSNHIEENFLPIMTKLRKFYVTYLDEDGILLPPTHSEELVSYCAKRIGEGIKNEKKISKKFLRFSLNSWIFLKSM